MSSAYLCRVCDSTFQKPGADLGNFAGGGERIFHQSSKIFYLPLPLIESSWVESHEWKLRYFKLTSCQWNVYETKTTIPQENFEILKWILFLKDHFVLANWSKFSWLMGGNPLPAPRPPIKSAPVLEISIPTNTKSQNQAQLPRFSKDAISKMLPKNLWDKAWLYDNCWHLKIAEDWLQFHINFYFPRTFLFVGWLYTHRISI